jgi:hypothetical protein
MKRTFRRQRGSKQGSKLVARSQTLNEPPVRESAFVNRALAINGPQIAALRAQGTRIHAVQPQFGPAFGIWLDGLFVTLDTTPPRPVVQCVRGTSATDPGAEVRARYVAIDDADAAALFNACLRLWTSALPLACTLRGQRMGCRAIPTETRRPQRRAAA